MTSNYTKQCLRIIVDADSCPVVEEISTVAGKYGVEVLLVASVAHYGRENCSMEKVYVDNLPQAVDMEIMNRLKAKDIVVTGDFGLASLVLAKGSLAISPRGHIFTDENIDRLLAERHISAKIRKGGGRTKGPKAFAAEDRQTFCLSLGRLIEGLVKQIKTPNS